MKCVICGKDSGKGQTCGSTCRSRLRRKQHNRTVASKLLQSVAKPKVLHKSDATVKQTDDRKLLDQWADGEGTDEQQVLGQLARKYEGYAAHRKRVRDANRDSEAASPAVAVANTPAAAQAGATPTQ